MTPSEKARERLRRLLDEVIPEHGTDKDTRFTNDELDDILSEAGSIYSAAAMGWIEKAGMYQREMMDVEQETTGQETYRMTSLRDRLAYALKMAETYQSMADGTTGGSRILKIAKPEVL